MTSQNRRLTMNANQAKYPQLRFKGFTDPWEERKFLNLAEVRRGLTYKPSDVQKYGIRVLRSSNIAEDTFLIKSDDVFVNKEAVKIDNVKNGDILITSANGSSRLVGKHALIEGIENDTVHGGFMLVARAEKPEFVNAIMSSSWYSKFINIFVSGGNGAIGNLSKSDLEDQKVYVPSEIEQTKIGLFFKGLDDTIALHQRKLAKLKELKQGYLQKLFPKNGSKFPQLRFAGFADAWEQRKLKQLVKSRDKDRIPIESGKRQAGKYPYYGATGIVDHVKDYIFEGTYLLLAEDGAIILDRTHPISYVVNGRFWVNNHAHTFQSSQGTDLTFLAESLERIHYQRYNTGTAQPKLNAKVVGKIEVLCPTSNEQRKLGKLSYLINVLIAANQRKLEKLQELKKGYLQKMFC